MRDAGQDLRDQENKHSEQVLVPLPSCPGRCHECENDDGTKHHSKELGFKDGELEALDNNVVESAESGCRQGCADLDQHVAVGLGVHQSLLELVRTEGLVLQTGLIGSNALDHALLVLFGEALGAHRRIREPIEHKQAPEERYAAIGDEDCLP